MIFGRKILLTSNPDKGHTGKRKIKYADHPRDVSNDDNKRTSQWPCMNLRCVCKITTYINHVSTNFKYIYAWSNYFNTVTAPRYSSVGERHVDQKIETFELKTSNNLPW